MSECGLGCIIFIWVSFLWPVIITVAYIVLKKVITRKSMYFLASIAAGYGMLIVINFLIMPLLKTSIDIEKITENGVNIEILTSSLFWIGLFTIYLPPILSSYLLAKKFSSLVD